MRLYSQKVLSLLKRSLTPNKPYHTQWLLTRRCNYRCRSCNVWREQQNVKEISTDGVKMGLDVFRKLGVVEVVFSGGDPLLRDDIDEILDYASRYFITTVYDNGSLALKKIDALCNVDFVAISLDTLDEKKQDYIKGVRGAWKRAMEAIETLNKEGIPVVVSPTISQLNLYEIVALTNYFIDRHIPVLYCLYSYDEPVETSMENGLFGIGKKVDEFEISHRQSMVDVCDELLRIKDERGGLFMTTKALKALRQLFFNGERVWRCGALQDFFMVDHLGRVAGCHLRQPVASVFELADLWDNQKFESLRNDYSKCQKCIYHCYTFYSLHGDMLSNLGIALDQRKNIRRLQFKT